MRFGKVQKHRLIGGITVLAASIALAATANASENSCEGPKALALVNGTIHTMDKQDSVVSSVLIGDGKLLSVGDDAYVADPCTEVIDLGGRTAVPGLIDNHNHIILLGLRPGNDVRLDKANSIQEALDFLAAKAGQVKNGEWITSLGGLHRNQFVPPPGAPRFPNLTELDGVAPKNPVLLFESFAGPSQTNSAGKAFFESRGISVARTGRSRRDSARGVSRSRPCRRCGNYRSTTIWRPRNRAWRMR